MDDKAFAVLKAARDLSYRKRDMRSYAQLRKLVYDEEIRRGAKDEKDFSEVTDRTPLRGGK